MLIRRKTAWDLPSSEITPEHIALNRRAFMASAGAAAFAFAGPATAAEKTEPFPVSSALTVQVKQGYEKLGPKDSVTFPISVFTYNNFAEFGPEKEDPAANSGNFKPRPWSIKVDGLCAKPGTIELDAFL